MSPSEFARSLDHALNAARPLGLAAVRPEHPTPQTQVYTLRFYDGFVIDYNSTTCSFPIGDGLLAYHRFRWAK